MKQVHWRSFCLSPRFRTWTKIFLTITSELPCFPLEMFDRICAQAYTGRGCWTFVTTFFVFLLNLLTRFEDITDQIHRTLQTAF